jgi:predicted nucleotidyltransferase
MSRTDRERVARVFESMPKVIAAWAFGSADRGAMTQDSDIDIGVLFDGRMSLDELADLREKLQQGYRFDDIDLVVVDDESTPILRFEVISGRALYCRDPQRRAEFVSLAAREYEDEMAFLERGMKVARGAASPR